MIQTGEVKSAHEREDVLFQVATGLRDNMNHPRWAQPMMTTSTLRVGRHFFIVNLELTGFLGTLAHLPGRLAIAASSIDPATDCIASLAVWVGLKLSTRSTRAFPYGLYKLENIIQIVMALLIFFAGFEIAHKVALPAVSSIIIKSWIIVGMRSSILVPLLLCYCTIAVGRRTG